MKRLWYYYLYLLLIWGSFRYFIKLPDVIEELWFKPVLWLTPLFWWSLSMKDRLTMFNRKWVPSLLWGSFIGVIYYLLIRKQAWQFSFDATMVAIALATAITEELTFSGFVTGYLEKIQKGKWINLLIVGSMVALIRLPILLFIYRVGGADLLGVLLFAGASGVINAWIRVETGNVAGSILARTGMNLAILG